jgi:hypothetical protein
MRLINRHGPVGVHQEKDVVVLDDDRPLGAHIDSWSLGRAMLM